MGAVAFMKLCNILKRKGDLQPTRWASVEEQVAKFRYIVGQNTWNPLPKHFLHDLE